MERDPIYQTVVDSITDAFETMLMVEVNFLEVEQFENSFKSTRIISTIGLGGHGVEAVLTLILSEHTTRELVKIMLGEEEVSDPAVLQDGVGELSNLIAGGIKKRLSDQEFDFSISLPFVITSEMGSVNTSNATTLYPFQFIVESEFPVEGVFLIREIVDENQVSTNLRYCTGK